MKKIILVLMVLVGVFSFGNAAGCTSPKTEKFVTTSSYKSLASIGSTEKNFDIRMFNVNVIGNNFKQEKLLSHYKCGDEYSSFFSKYYLANINASITNIEKTILRNLLDGKAFSSDRQKFLIFSTEKKLSDEEKEVLKNRYSSEIGNKTTGFIVRSSSLNRLECSDVVQRDEQMKNYTEYQLYELNNHREDYNKCSIIIYNNYDKVYRLTGNKNFSSTILKDLIENNFSNFSTYVIGYFDYSASKKEVSNLSKYLKKKMTFMDGYILLINEENKKKEWMYK